MGAERERALGRRSSHVSVTLTGPLGRRIRLQSIEDFILFVEAVEREYPSATPQGVASEIRQLWCDSEAWRAMPDSRGIEAAGRAVDIETRPNPIAERIDMAELVRLVAAASCSSRRWGRSTSPT